jgi:ribosomal protein L11 methyltransferase
MSARYILTCPARSLEAAQVLADQFENHIAIDVLAVSVNEVDEKGALWNTVAYFSEEEAALAARDALKIDGEITALPDVDWVRQSLQGLVPVVAGRFQLYGSHDRERKRAGGFSFEIDAGTAFGTGHHGTTAGCLLILDRLLKQKKPRRVFDLGCGTGVLALAAARATTAKVLATDIDPEAVRITRLNASRNKLDPCIHAFAAAGLHHQAIRAGAPFDLIFANILARPLVGLAQGLSQILAPGGIVILSGLTRDQLRWISACYRARGLVPLHMVRIENWVAIALLKKGIKAKRLKHGSRRFNVSAAAPGWELDL